MFAPTGSSAAIPSRFLPDAGNIDVGVMQAIAAEFNLSETVFVLPPANAHHSRLTSRPSSAAAG